MIVNGTVMVEPLGSASGSLTVRAPLIEVGATGSIIADVAGGRGGLASPLTSVGGFGGEGLPRGCGGGKGSSVGQAGSGAGYGGAGGPPNNQWGNGNPCNVCDQATIAHCVGTPGPEYGSADGPDWSVGAGGGAAGNSSGCSSSGGRGGNGGGAVVLVGDTVRINGTVSANGEEPPADPSACGYRAGGGGGAGGAIVIAASVSAEGTASLSVLGGNGGEALGDQGGSTWAWSGGGGGGGRIKVFAPTSTLGGSTMTDGGLPGVIPATSQSYAGLAGGVGTFYEGASIPAELDAVCN